MIGRVEVDIKGAKKALRQFEPDVRKEFRREVFKDIASMLADKARPHTPRRTGRLAASWKGSTAGVVSNNKPYAAFIYWGGTTGKGHSRSRPGSVRLAKKSFRVNGQTIRAANPAVHVAFNRNKRQVARELEKGMARVAKKHGLN